MIDKLNISIEDKNTKKIEYKLYSDDGGWVKSEYDSNQNMIYNENSDGYWSKSEYDNEGKRVYFETIYGVIKHKR